MAQQEYVFVSFPGVSRSVFADGDRIGKTNALLTVDPGEHTFDLGEPADYRPVSIPANVIGTSAGNPLRLTFKVADL